MLPNFNQRKIVSDGQVHKNKRQNNAGKIILTDDVPLRRCNLKYRETVQPTQLSSWCKQEEFFLLTPPMKMEKCVPKRLHTKFRRQRIIRKEEHNIQNRAQI